MFLKLSSIVYGTFVKDRGFGPLRVMEKGLQGPQHKIPRSSTKNIGNKGFIVQSAVCHARPPSVLQQASQRTELLTGQFHRLAAC